VSRYTGPWTCDPRRICSRLRFITDNLGPEKFAKCGAFFAENGHFDKVVSLFITCTDKYPSKALELCMKRSVQVSEKMA
jgi:hypothetical protein